jgi:hypothetical protein
VHEANVSLGYGFQPDWFAAVSMPIEISPKVPVENSLLRYASIASKATRWLDVGEDVKIEIDNGLESLGGGAVAKAVGQGVAPGGVFCAASVCAMASLPMPPSRPFASSY